MGPIKLFRWWRARINNNMHPIFQYFARKELTKAAPDIFSNQIGWKLQMILQSARACPPNQSGSSIVTVGPILWRRWEIWFELSILSLSRGKFYCSNISARNLLLSPSNLHRKSKCCLILRYQFWQGRVCDCPCWRGACGLCFHKFMSVYVSK